MQGAMLLMAMLPTLRLKYMQQVLSLSALPFPLFMCNLISLFHGA
jgi:hypothetical protein